MMIDVAARAEREAIVKWLKSEAESLSIVEMKFDIEWPYGAMIKHFAVEIEKGAHHPHESGVVARRAISPS